MEVLAVIPARGGSKGVPRKNLRPLGDRPLVAHSVAAALGASRVSRVVVSTDDEEIAEAARQAGAEVPFLRPVELADDLASSIDAVVHAVEEVERLADTRFDAVLMLQPTSPFRTSADIDAAVAKLEATGADSVISVVDVGGTHPARMKHLGDDDRLVDPPFAEARENQNRQELTPMYIRNGAIYLTRRDVLAGRSFKGRDSRALVMPAGRSANIDSELDLRFATWLLEAGLVSDEPAR